MRDNFIVRDGNADKFEEALSRLCKVVEKLICVEAEWYVVPDFQDMRGIVVELDDGNRFANKYYEVFMSCHEQACDDAELQERFFRRLAGSVFGKRCDKQEREHV